MSATKSVGRFVLRFTHPDHHARLKALAERERRSLNAQLLLLIEAGESALYPTTRKESAND